METAVGVLVERVLMAVILDPLRGALCRECRENGVWVGLYGRGSVARIPPLEKQANPAGYSP